MNGYHNRVAWLDLTARRVEINELDPDLAGRHWGGANLGAALLADLTGAGTDPLGPDNPLIFTTGPLTATGIPFSSRHEVVALSPLTGIYGEANCGGALGWQLKRSGLDGLVITGTSHEPVVVVIDDREISFRDAADLWGRDTYDVDAALKEEYDRKGVSALIGQAGENLVRFASISHDGRHTRAAGRCGMGAVAGSKRLKGLFITSRGKTPTPVADAEAVKELSGKAVGAVRERLDLFGKIGTPGGVANYNKLGNLPINNWRDADNAPIAEATTGTVMKETIWVSRAGCKLCPVQCGRMVEIPEGEFAINGRVEGPEYETLAAFGSLCLNGDLEAVAKANELCNKHGLDTITTGAVIAFAMECVEKGVIGPDLLEGLDLRFGNGAAMVDTVRRIALGRGELARILGQGVKEAAGILGGDAPEYAVHVKGLEFPMHDPRFSWGHAISYSTGNRGACHLSSLSHPFEMAVALPELGHPEPFPGREREGKAAWTIKLQNLMTALDSLCLCRFAMLNNCLTITDFIDFLGAVFGREVTVEEFMSQGERGFTLKRMINNRRGITRKDDLLPPRMRILKKRGRDFDFDIPPMWPMLSEFYDLRGWTEEGRPGPETMTRLDLQPLD